MIINIRTVLADNNIKQKDFIEYIGYTRQGFIKALQGKPKQPMIDSLKLFVADKKGVSIDVEL